MRVGQKPSIQSMPLCLHKTFPGFPSHLFFPPSPACHLRCHLQTLSPPQSLCSSHTSLHLLRDREHAVSPWNSLPPRWSANSCLFFTDMNVPQSEMSLSTFHSLECHRGLFIFLSSLQTVNSSGQAVSVMFLSISPKPSTVPAT